MIVALQDGTHSGGGCEANSRTWRFPVSASQIMGLGVLAFLIWGWDGLLDLISLYSCFFRPLFSFPPPGLCFALGNSIPRLSRFESGKASMYEY